MEAMKKCRKAKTVGTVGLESEDYKGCWNTAKRNSGVVF